MHSLKYTLILFFMILPLNLVGQANEAYSELTQARQQGEVAMSSLVESITSLTEVYRTKEVNARKRFILEVNTHLAQGIVALQSAQEHAQKSLKQANEAISNTTISCIHEAEKVFGQTKLILSEAATHASKALHDTNKTQAQADLQALTPLIEEGVVQLNEALDLLEEVVN